MRSHSCRTLRLVALAAGLALVGAGCGSGADTPDGTSTSSASSDTTAAADSTAATTDGPPAGAAASRACELVTGAEAATALGPAGELAATVDTPDLCEYEAANGVDSVSVSLEAESYAAGTEDILIKGLGEDRAKKAPGLGDAAVVFDVGFQVQYHVWAKGQYVMIAVTIVDGQPAAAARSVTEKAISRL